MPSDDGLGLDDGQRFPPTLPQPGQEDPKKPIRPAKPRPPRSSLEDRELMSEGQVLDSECPLRLKNGDQRAKYGEKHDKEPIAAIGLTASPAIREGTASSRQINVWTRNPRIAIGPPPAITAPFTKRPFARDVSRRGSPAGPTGRATRRIRAHARGIVDETARPRRVPACSGLAQAGSRISTSRRAISMIALASFSSRCTIPMGMGWGSGGSTAGPVEDRPSQPANRAPWPLRRESPEKDPTDPTVESCTGRQGSGPFLVTDPNRA